MTAILTTQPERPFMICPLCLEKPTKVTREHLPFKALYKGLSSKAHDAAAIVKICENCNQEKSIWDQEFLALYGDRLDLDRAHKSQISLKNLNQIPNALSLALVASRAASVTGKAIMDYNGIPCDIISQWMWRCGRGIYQYFEKKPFLGNRVLINPNLIDHNIHADQFSFGDEPLVHQINSGCWIWMMRRSDEPPMIFVSMVDTKSNRMFSVHGIFFENEEQFNASKSTQPVPINLKPMRVARPREVFDVPTTENGGFSYKGVKKLRKDDRNA
jgi:hypothetical protein